MKYKLITAIVLMAERQRKTRTYRLDTLVIDAWNELAKRRGISANRLLEITMFDMAKEEGIISADTPRLGETRGGDFSQRKS
ncbi:MAG: hypothetical protein KI793_26540 [Rivularia sp. (in: Bacteria)]|nr:hypothetical protein [Rivularia sp. MS3]